MYDLANFGLGQMVASITALKRSTAGTQSMEEAAQKIVQYFYDYLIDGQTGEKACALVRFYKTHAHQDLDPSLQATADALLDGMAAVPMMKHLVLLATAGDKPEWNSRATSLNHKLIPLPSAAIVQQSPMIAQLITQLGLEIGSVINPDSSLLSNMADTRYNVFYVPQARGSAFIPAQQEFVIPNGIQSVIGFGGMLASGDLFAVVLFSKVPIPAEVAAIFRSLAIDTKGLIMSFPKAKTFR